MTRPLRSALFPAFLTAAMAMPAVLAAQSADGRPRVSVGVELGLAAFDARHTLNAAPLFLTPGVEVRTRGRVFAFAGVRALVFAIPVSGSGGDRVSDENGNPGFRTTGELGGGPWLRAGAGTSLTDSPRAPTVTVAAGSLGLGSDAHLWLGASAGVPLRGAWRVEAEVGADRNWVEDRFFQQPPNDVAPSPGPPGPTYTRRSEEWFSTMQLGVRYRL